MIYSYYGGWHDVSIKPKSRVHLYMLDEYVKKTIEIEREKLHKEINHIISDFKKHFNPKEDITALKIIITDFKKTFEMICDLNELKKPPVENKLKKSKVVTPIGENNDE